MLAPDLEQTQAALTNSFSAAEVITIYSGAMRYIIGPMIAADDFPSWFDSVKKTVAAAVDHGSGWMDDLCIDLTTAVPDAIIGFNTEFQKVSDQLINLQTEIIMSGNVASPAQQKTAIDLFTEMQSKLSSLTPSMKEHQRQITALLGAIQSDHDAMGTAQATISANIPDGGTISKQITADLGDDFLSVTPNGPCMVSLSIKTDVDATIKRTAGHNTELLPYLIAQQVLTNALSDNAKATQAFSQVLNTWSFMAGLVDSAIEDLSKGAAKDVPNVLRQADFSMAQRVWASLSETAHNLKQNNS